MKTRCPNTRAYTRRITIQSRVETTRNVLNEVTESWTTYHKCRAMGKPLSGREYNQAQQVQAVTTHRYRVLYNTLTKAITPKMRMLDTTDGSVTLQITRVINVENANREMELECVEVV